MGRTIANNKKAYHDFFIKEKYEAGIELQGMEVKSIKSGKVSIKEAYVKNFHDELFIINMYVKKYEYHGFSDVDETRRRKLLLHRKEINKLKSKMQKEKLTLIPLQVYEKNRLIKVSIGLAKGKNLHDKRNELAKQDQKREMDKAIKELNR
ncbi:MAG: SsrA-binding protein [Fusobacteriia bacterium 4572_132]|nr:MAG: SsrA-binding protein [Fusobacteriia bacterium 4572_132]